MSPIWGALNKKSLHCLWMTTMNLWSTTDAGCAHTKTSRNKVRTLCWKNMRKEQFSSFLWMLHFFHRFQTVISIAMSKHYILQMNHRFVLRGVYCLYFLLVFLFLIVSFSVIQTGLKTEKVHSWGASVFFLLKILIKHHLFISVSIPNADIFKFSSL